jgi:hypothetical protein
MESTEVIEQLNSICGDEQTANLLRIIPVFIAKALFESLDGTIIKDGMERILLDMKEQIPTSKLIDLYERKIRYSGFGKKSYAAKNDIIAAILKGLVCQKKLQIRL